jgi:hypothetical protein
MGLYSKVYPKELLPYQTYPAVLPSEEVLDCFFVRETNEDIYLFFGSGFNPYHVDDVIRQIIAPPTSKRDVFELSVFLYGYYNKDHIGIRQTDKGLNNAWNNEIPDISAEDISYTQWPMFPLFLSTTKLYEQPVDFSGEKFVSSFLHKPTIANYWHFQLFTKDDEGKVIPRDKDSPRLKRLAKHVLENIIIPAICLETTIKRFQRADFDGKG